MFAGFFCDDCNFSYFFLGWLLSGLIFSLLFALFDQIGLENKFAHSTWHTNFTWVCNKHEFEIITFTVIEIPYHQFEYQENYEN